MGSDPTYDRKKIDANPAWALAFILSEIDNDGAPLGWGKYIWKAEEILKVFDVKRKADTYAK